MRSAAWKIAGFLCLLLAAALARGDGPHIAFHGTAGETTVTLFSAPDPLAAGPADLSLLAQNTADSSLLRSVEAHGTLTLPGHTPVPFTLTSGAGKQGLMTATVRLPDPGTYSLTLIVRAPGAKVAQFGGSLPVEPNHGRRNTVLFFVLLPAILAALFLVNQHAKQRLRSGYRPKA